MLSCVNNSPSAVSSVGSRIPRSELSESEIRLRFIEITWGQELAWDIRNVPTAAFDAKMALAAVKELELKTVIALASRLMQGQA